MRHRSQHLSSSAVLLATLIVAALFVPLPVGMPQPKVAEARPLEPRIAAGGAFGNAVPCLGEADTFATTLGLNTLYFPSGSRLSQGQALDLPAVQTVSTGGAGPGLAALRSVGAVYGLAYDDGRASGRERLFAAAFTKRLVGYGPAGAGGIYVFQRIGAGWSLIGSLAVPGVTGSHSSGNDGSTVAQIGKTGLGDLEVSPDGRTLFVVNLGPKRLERFDLTGAAIPTHLGSVSIDLTRVSASATVRADLWPFALEFYPFPAAGTSNQQLLLVGVTDSAERGIVGGRPQMSGANFAVSPQAHVLAYNLATGGWGRMLSQDLGNDASLSARHNGSTYGDYGNWNNNPGNYTVKAWNPWRGTLAGMAGSGQTITYPQPWLTDIEFLSYQPAPGAPAWDTPLMALGLRDRTGDQVFNANLVTGAIPAGEQIATGQGDTLTYRFNGSAWALQSGESFDDNTHFGGPWAHIENHMGALASVPNDRAGVASMGESLAITSLGGLGTQEVRMFGWAAGPSASSASTARPGLIGPNTHAATKASNLGDLEVLCSYALAGGRVWNDISYNGIQDAGEAGIAGVTLEVFDNSGLPATAPALASATTDSLGRYLFAVPPNTPLGIRIATSSRRGLSAQGYLSFTAQNRGASDTADSDASPTWGYIEFAPAAGSRTGAASAINPLWREGEGRTFDIGLKRVQPTGSIGDRVWSDSDADGVQDAGEVGVAGITVTLESSGAAAALADINVSAVTDSLGRYRFRDLAPGFYKVRFSVPAGMRATLRDQGGDDARDSDADASASYTTADFALPDGQIDDTRDFGLIASADVELSKSGPAAAAADQAFSYTLTVRNRTAGPALSVEVADTLPAGLSFVAATPAPTARAGQALRWSLGDLPGNAARTITLNVRAPLGFAPAAAVSQAIANCASATTASPDANPANNSACAPTTLQRPEVSIVKAGPATPVLVGDEFTYSLAYANTGSLAAAGVTIADTLPAGLAFVRFSASPGGCAATATSVSCAIAGLAPGARGALSFVVRSDVATVGPSVTNRATISTTTPGDDPGDNSSTTTTAIQFPNPGVSLRIDPRPLPVGEPGSITAAYGNAGSGLARSAALTITHEPGATLGALPAGCAYTALSRRVVCALGDLAPGASGSVVLPLRLPATPADGATFAADSFGATAQIGAATPERAADLADNSADAQVDVVRPNVYVTAAGPDDSVRLAWGSGFVYDVGYGNLHRAAPGLTRAAEGSVLAVTLPDDVAFLTASTPPTSVSGQVLVWELGTLAPQAAAALRIAVRTDVPAGTLLHMEATISTTTPGDDPRDNRAAVDTTVVRPPAVVPAPAGGLRLAIHSELDPQHGGADESDAVYLTPPGATAIAWPAGEVLDFAPRLDRYELEAPGWPLEYRARVTGWSLEGFTNNGRAAAATAADSRGIAGCRGAGAPPAAGSALVGCAYEYVGAFPEGRTIDDFLPAAALLREAEMASQARVYWTHPPAPPMAPEVYLFTLAPLAPPRLVVAVEVEVWAVNACPDFLIDPLGACGAPIELPEPGRTRQTVGQAFDVTLVVPRSVVGPAGLPGR